MSGHAAFSFRVIRKSICVDRKEVGQAAVLTHAIYRRPTLYFLYTHDFINRPLQKAEMVRTEFLVKCFNSGFNRINIS